MAVLLPRKEDGLAAFEAMLTADHLETWLSKLRPREVIVELPKFKVEAEFELRTPLSAMGMPIAFSDAADFSGMTGSRDLSIDAVVLKAFVDVNEEGTEAAAATGIVMAESLDIPQVFRADHPFVFLIQDDRTGSILFMGASRTPKGSWDLVHGSPWPSRT